MTMTQILALAWLPIVLLISGALLSVLGTALAMHQQTAAETSLREKTEKIVGVVTSGDAYPHGKITHPSGDKNILDLSVFNDGEYPLYDVQVRVVDVIAMRKKIEENRNAGRENISSSDMVAFETIINIGPMGPSRGIMDLGYRRILDKEDQQFHFNLFFHQRFGAQTMQSIQGQRRADGSWARFDQVKRGGEVLKESESEDFIEETFEES